MKKVLLLALALNFVACSTDNNEDNSVETAKVTTSTFNANPSPDDYRKANDANFVKDEKALLEQANITKKTAAVWVNATIPDANLRAALINIGAGDANDGTPNDNTINIDKTRGGLYLAGANISDATGLQAFTSLSQLIINGNNLTSLNVSGIPTLTWLECQYNQLTTLNLTSNTNLTQIWCHNNLLTSLSLPANVSGLWGLWCYGNQLSTLNLNGNVNLTSLFVQINNFSTLSTASLTSLKMVNLSYNKWVTLNYSTNSQLNCFWCYNNTLLTDINLKNGNNAAITIVDFSGNTKRPAIHVDANFVAQAPILWTPSGGSVYQL
ncbi:hypothetical protein EV143_102326 [Flavobacterium chryseum]|uniref:leucine-rich repeat domain-containing protein n=1 Tax=Flavobacterium sp. P3160 TaxID=2512113 RepID=UPI00106009F3|nr:hypothetical protein [Flavobacterium sp. P3160]TDO83062.1 hypothetical protein EV143_102326 [Flavobacterium sp. P3160]